jgi:hypothetical protein
VWRLGHISGPLEFPPRDRCSWANRFDDSRRRFRTLYCSRERATALRETLADFRLNTKAVAEFRALASTLGGDPDLPRARVPAGWRTKRLLAPARIEYLAGGELIDLNDPRVRAELERQHASLLHRHGMDHLDISQIRSRDRRVTQELAFSLFDRGAVGVAYGSNLDDLPCYALFESRALLVADGDPELLTPALPDFVRICLEFGLEYPR